MFVHIWLLLEVVPPLVWSIFFDANAQVETLTSARTFIPLSPPHLLKLSLTWANEMGGVMFISPDLIRRPTCHRIVGIIVDNSCSRPVLHTVRPVVPRFWSRFLCSSFYFSIYYTISHIPFHLGNLQFLNPEFSIFLFDLQDTKIQIPRYPD